MQPLVAASRASAYVTGVVGASVPKAWGREALKNRERTRNHYSIGQGSYDIKEGNSPGAKALDYVLRFWDGWFCCFNVELTGGVASFVRRGGLVAGTTR